MIGILKEVQEELEIEAREDLVAIGNGQGDDFHVELSDGREFRFIHTDIINKVFHEECMETIQDCYEGLDKIPSFVEIDWKATTNNCLVDGFGHQFSIYDGEELEIAGKDRRIAWHVFRNN